jgi:hypothetical protein
MVVTLIMPEVSAAPIIAQGASRTAVPHCLSYISARVRPAGHPLARPGRPGDGSPCPKLWTNLCPRERIEGVLINFVSARIRASGQTPQWTRSSRRYRGRPGLWRCGKRGSWFHSRLTGDRRAKEERTVPTNAIPNPIQPTVGVTTLAQLASIIAVPTIHKSQQI